MNRTDRIQTALICGAGIGGLAAALSLAKTGKSVTVIEKAPALLEVGAGLQLSPNAMHVLDALGVGNHVANAAFEPDLSVIRDYKSGEILTEIPTKDISVQRYGAPYFHIHRADLLAILETAAKEAGVEILLDQQAVSFSQSQAQAHLQTNNALHSADILIGADGIRSIIRDTMLGPEPPAFTGQVAWRGLVPTDALPPNLIAPNATVWVGPHHHFVTYYVRQGTLVNFVAVQERDDWTNTGWTERGDVNELRSAFKGWHPEIQTLLNATKDSFLWALFGRDPLPIWTDKRVALLGDAAHPMLPFMAQGAAMAIEDAWVLADSLNHHPAEEALRTYERLRKPRATMVQQMSLDNAKLFHRRSGFSDLWPRAKLSIGKRIPRAALIQLDKVYAVDVTKRRG